jgi:hypothetical protein
VHRGLTIGQGIPRDIAAGIFKKHAAGRAGVSERTFHAWIERGGQQLSRLHAYDTENPGALDCTHTWTKTKTPRCKHCNTAKSTWDDLQTTDQREGPYVDFLQSCLRATSEAIAQLVADVRSATGAQAREVLYDREGRTIVIAGKVQTAKPDRGDWRAAAWLVERMDPEQYHLPTKVEVGGDPDGAPIEVSVLDQLQDELDHLNRNMTASDAARVRALRGGQDGRPEGEGAPPL